jgi:hypothetical protein
MAQNLLELAPRAEELAADLIRAAERLTSSGEVVASPITYGALQSGPYSDLIWLDTAQAGALSGFHKDTVRRACESDELHGSQRTKGGRWRIHRDCLEAWLAGVPCAHRATGSRTVGSRPQT